MACRVRAATVSRIALIVFLVFYTAYEVTVGLGTGILVDYAKGLPAAEQAAVADAIQHINRNALVGDPASVSLIAGVLGWVVAMLAAAVAFRRAGAGWLVTLLLGFAALFAIHPPPVGPAALVCFAVAAVLIDRWNTRKPARTGKSPAFRATAGGASLGHVLPLSRGAAMKTPIIQDEPGLQPTRSRPLRT